jgi:hypothetical protein
LKLETFNLKPKYGFIFGNLGMGRAVLGIADVGNSRLGIVVYNHYDSRQLRINRYRNDKNSGGLF